MRRTLANTTSSYPAHTETGNTANHFLVCPAHLSDLQPIIDGQLSGTDADIDSFKGSALSQTIANNRTVRVTINRTVGGLTDGRYSIIATLSLVNLLSLYGLFNADCHHTFITV